MRHTPVDEGRWQCSIHGDWDRTPTTISEWRCPICEMTKRVSEMKWVKSGDHEAKAMRAVNEHVDKMRMLQASVADAGNVRVCGMAEPVPEHNPVAEINWVELYRTQTSELFSERDALRAEVAALEAKLAMASSGDPRPIRDHAWCVGEIKAGRPIRGERIHLDQMLIVPSGDAVADCEITFCPGIPVPTTPVPAMSANALKYWR